MKIPYISGFFWSNADTIEHSAPHQSSHASIKWSRVLRCSGLRQFRALRIASLVFDGVFEDLVGAGVSAAMRCWQRSAKASALAELGSGSRVMVRYPGSVGSMSPMWLKAGGMGGRGLRLLLVCSQWWSSSPGRWPLWCCRRPYGAVVDEFGLRSQEVLARGQVSETGLGGDRLGSSLDCHQSAFCFPGVPSHGFTWHW